MRFAERRELLGSSIIEWVGEVVPRCDQSVDEIAFGELHPGRDVSAAVGTEGAPHDYIFSSILQ